MQSFGGVAGIERWGVHGKGLTGHRIAHMTQKDTLEELGKHLAEEINLYLGESHHHL